MHAVVPVRHGLEDESVWATGYTDRRTPRGVHPVNSPRAGRQQGSAGSGGCAGSPYTQLNEALHVRTSRLATQHRVAAAYDAHYLALAERAPGSRARAWD